MGRDSGRVPAGSPGMWQQLQRLQQHIAQAQERLAQETVTASAGGGAVRITMSGDLRCRAVEIAPDLLVEADVGMMQDLVLTAINLALEEGRELQKRLLGPLVGGLPF